MPQAPSRSGLTPAQARELARAARSARKPSDLALAMAQRASLAVIGTRERAAEKMKSVLRSLFLPVNPYDGDQIAEFTTAAARQLGAAQKATAIAAAAGQVQMLSTMGVQVKARPSAPIDVRAPRVSFTATGVDLEPVGVAVRYAGQDPVRLSAADMTTVEVLNRPFRKMRYLESQGATREQALEAGIVRLDSTIDANLMLSQRLAEAEVINAAAQLDSSPVVGMRRIIHPELSLTGTCGLCIAASDRLYTVRELLPMHRLCKCTSAAVTEEFDPADALNAVDLRQLYRDAGGTSRAHLKRTRYKEDQHGELGPTLKPERTYKPRGKKAEGGPGTGSVLDESPAEVARRQLPLFEANLAKLQADGISDDSSQVKYHKEQIAKYRERIAAEVGSSGTGTRLNGGAAAKKGMRTDIPEPQTSASGSGTEPPVPPRNIPPMAGAPDDKYPDMDNGEPAPLRPSDIRPLNEEDLAYIMDGDGEGAGGHGFGTGIPDKSEFPSTWDEAKVQVAVESVLWGPGDNRTITPTKDGVVFRGVYDNVILAVPVHDYGKYWEVASAYPLSGAGVGRNDSAGSRVAVPLNLDDLTRTLKSWS